MNSTERMWNAINSFNWGNGKASHQPHTFLEYAGMLQIQGFPVNVEKSAITGIFIFMLQ